MTIDNLNKLALLQERGFKLVNTKEGSLIVGIMEDGTPSAWERTTDEEAVTSAYADVIGN